MASQETDQSELTTEFATAKGLTAGATAVAQPESNRIERVFPIRIQISSRKQLELG